MREFHGRRPLSVALLAGLVGAGARSQNPPSFEVSSIRQAQGGPLRIESDPGRISMRSQAADVLIRLAFGLREYQYEGPSWLHTTRYDIVATTSSPQPRSVQLWMLRALLTE